MLGSALIELGKINEETREGGLGIGDIILYPFDQLGV
jgi:hypothetical protein